MQGIDVEAAVGRPGEGSHKSPEPQAARRGGEGPEELVPKSPKREAEENLESGASKRAKEDGEAAEDTQSEEKQEPEKDAEGDVVITDQTASGEDQTSQFADGDNKTNRIRMLGLAQRIWPRRNQAREATGVQGDNRGAWA